MSINDGNDGNGVDVGAAGVKRNWVLSSGGVACFKDPAGGQTVVSLMEVDETSEFHDDALADATRQINAIIDKLESDNADSERVLSLIEFQNRHLLVWARYGAVGPHDDEATVRKALKLKA